MVTNINLGVFSLVVSVGAVFIAIVGSLLVFHNLILILLIIETIFLISSFNFILYGELFGDIGGQVFTLFVLAIAAVETAVGLSILVMSFQISRQRVGGY